jgi:hypothetical protein
MAAGYWAPLAIATTDGPTLTSAAAASCLPTSAKYTFAPNVAVPGMCLRIKSSGRISCVVTTPGTARLDFRIGGNVFFDTGALNLNIVAKTTVPWWFEAILSLRQTSSGPTAAQWFGQGLFQSEAVVGSAANTAGGNGCLLAPVGTPALGTAQDWTGGGAFDCFFTQTVATGSFTVHQFILESALVAVP